MENLLSIQCTCKLIVIVVKDAMRPMQSYTIVFDINIQVTYLNLARKEVQFYWLFSFLKRVETQTLQKIQLPFTNT